MISATPADPNSMSTLSKPPKDATMQSTEKGDEFNRNQQTLADSLKETLQATTKLLQSLLPS